MINLFDFILFKFRFHFYSKRMIESYQARNAKKIVSYAANNSQFFREYYGNYGEFSSLPLTNKKIMMDNLTAYNTIGLNKQDLIDFALSVEKSRDFSKRFNGINIGMSSGTSGNKGIIITTQEEEDFLKMMYLSRLTIPEGKKLNCAFILRVFSPAFNYNSKGHKITYVNQLQPIENMCKDIETINPNVLSSPPSILKLLAKEVLKGNLKINPELIYSYAETLYPDVKDFIEKTFDCRVLQIYQGSEGCYAISCKEGSLHINEDIVLFELVGNPCAKPLVTDLHKKSQPIIRYELNDIITISEKKCKCGSNFRVIESIQGRADDMLWGKKDDVLHHIFPDYIVRALMCCSDKIEDFQVVQKSLDELHISIMPESNVKDKVIGAVQDVFRKYGCAVPNVVVEFKKPEPNSNSNKLTRVICEMKI